MIITRTPFRISFFGGGTDYPDWYLHHGGSALATTIDKYCYLSVRYLPPFHEHRFRVVWSKMELVSHVDEIEHPAVRAVLKYLGINRGVEIHHNGDLPARSGMGSSSAFTVGLLHAMYALCGRMISKQQLARESIHLEQEVLREVVGSQDQVSAAYGGLNHISFLTDGNIKVQPLPISRSRLEDLNSHLMLFYTGVKRTAAQVAQTYVNGLAAKQHHLERMKQMVTEAAAILSGPEDIDRFGKLLHEAWLVKRDLSAQVSNPQVDAMYETARRHGASGGKLLGAGGGGFMLLFAPPDCHKAIRDAFADLIYVPIRFEFDGSRVIFFDLDQDYEEYDSARSRQRLRPVVENEAFTP